MAAMRSARADVLTVYPTKRRVRGLIGDRAVIDSERCLLVWEADAMLPLYAVPREDVEAALLEHGPPPADGTARPSAAELFSLAAEGERAVGAAWSYSDPDLDAYLGFDWNAVDRWLEEDEEVRGHPRDPFHRVDALASSRRVIVELEGHVVADTRRPVLVFETGLPVRYYLPPADVTADLLRPSDARTLCPYKGVASYHHVRVAGRTHENLLWHYAEPLAPMNAIAGLLAPYNERVQLIVDGERLPG